MSDPLTGGLQPFEYTGWRDEQLSWYNKCYIHTHLNPLRTYVIKGVDSLKFLKKYCVNSFEKFPVGKTKHVIMCNENGLNIADGILLRTGENEFLASCLTPWIQYCLETSGMDVEGEDITGKDFMFQIAGPKSLEVLEAASGDNLHDVKFLSHRMSKMLGKDIRILRVGMVRSLGYEVFGKIEDAIPIFNQIMKAGNKYGICRLGTPAYNMTHWECGFPQAFLDFPFAWFEHEGFAKWLGLDPSYAKLKGSMEPDIKLYYRNPIELGWGNHIKFDHDFLGKEALQKILESPHREMVTLEWNKEDILDIHRSQLEDKEPYTDISKPDDISYEAGQVYHADKVLNKDGKCIGISTGRMVSWYYREMISICSIDQEYSKEGTETFVLWGNPKTRQKKIRARVVRFPYMKESRTIDVNDIPLGTMD
jgi:glycine cleavage system aminomethyltransferase T